MRPITTTATCVRGALLLIAATFALAGWTDGNPADEAYQRGIERIQNVAGLLLVILIGAGLFIALRSGVRLLRRLL